MKVFGFDADGGSTESLPLSSILCDRVQLSNGRSVIYRLSRGYMTGDEDMKTRRSLREWPWMDGQVKERDGWKGNQMNARIGE
jgi:hypothetical protein